eukprot:11977242-Alexandrium_andersonii.AAC.1
MSRPECASVGRARPCPPRTSRAPRRVGRCTALTRRVTTAVMAARPCHPHLMVMVLVVLVMLVMLVVLVVLVMLVMLVVL